MDRQTSFRAGAFPQPCGVVFLCSGAIFEHSRLFDTTLPHCCGNLNSFFGFFVKIFRQKIVKSVKNRFSTYSECRGEHCSPANLAQHRLFGEIYHRANGHGRAMPAPTNRFFAGPCSKKSRTAFTVRLNGSLIFPSSPSFCGGGRARCRPWPREHRGYSSTGSGHEQGYGRTRP